MPFKIWCQIEEDDFATNVGEAELLEEFSSLHEAQDAMANLVALSADVFRERLITFSGLSLSDFARIVYGKPCVELEHVREYLLDKHAKFQEDPVGLILTLDSRNFQRVYEYLIHGGGHV